MVILVATYSVNSTELVFLNKQLDGLEMMLFLPSLVNMILTLVYMGG